MGKKRKLEVIDPDAEKTLYTSFVTAANSISHLYTQAVQQQRKSSAAASRQTLERIAHFLMREYGTEDHVSKAALMHFLNQEYESIEGCENMPHQFPVQMFPVVQQGAPVEGGEDANVMENQTQVRRSQVGNFLSPGRRNMQHGAAAMDDSMEQFGVDPPTHGSNQPQAGFGFTF